MSAEASLNGVASTTRPRRRARSIIRRWAASSNSNCAKNSLMDAARTWAGAGAPGATSAPASIVWNFTAVAPAAAAASISASARSIDPPWFRPISAITNNRENAAMEWPPISSSGCSKDMDSPVSSHKACCNIWDLDQRAHHRIGDER